MNYKNWRVDGNPESDLLIHDKGISHFLVKADIATCFPSIYTHAIPWAAVGKEKAKNSIRTDTWYNRIDERCREMCNGETHGLLIGPHTSNLIAEIILTVVDKKLYALDMFCAGANTIIPQGRVPFLLPRVSHMYCKPTSLHK